MFIKEQLYDIDLVCSLLLSKEEITQKRLKELIGLEIGKYASSNNMNQKPEERRRCWRLNYSDGAHFHLDVLPSIPDQIHQTGNEIAITDNRQPNYSIICKDWVCCNPVDYQAWFTNRMEVRLKAMIEAYKARAEDVPEYKIKTPLQRAVQLLKYHRDRTYNGHPDDKPVSILITTLAAHAYNDEADVLEALVNIVTIMSDFIEEKDGVLWVANPVNTTENFADKWQEYPKRQEVFFDWLTKAELDILEIANTRDLKTATKSLKSYFGEKPINEAINNSNLDSSKLANVSSSKALTKHKTAFLVPHRQSPKWEMQLTPDTRVKVSTKVIRKGFRPKNYFDSGSEIPKDNSLRFTANTNVKKPYEVHWQVVNTGDDAAMANALRGGFYGTSEIRKGKRVRKESTLYTGKHWVECFIVKNGICVARSGEYVVNIE